MIQQLASPNAVIYARYSSDKQNEQSIDGQLRACHEYAERCGYHVIGEYIDKAASAHTHIEKRVDFLRMIEDSRKKQFKYVIVWKMDRFSRNYYEAAIYKNKLKQNGVRVLSVTEAIGDNKESILVESLLDSIAELYSRQVSENTRRGMAEAARQGKTTGGNIATGYRISELHTLSVDEKTAPIIRLVFKLYDEGKTKTQIANELNARGYHTKNGKKWTVTSFDRILTNRMYIGDYTYSGEIERACPAIIEKELFERVQTRYEAQKKSRGKRVTEEVDYKLAGKLFCGLCGSHMVGDCGTSRSGERHYYYTCNDRKKRRGCKKKSERKGYLEWYVVSQTVEYVLAPERIELIADAIVDSYNKMFPKSVASDLKKRLEDIDAELERLADALISAKSQALIDKVNARSLILEKEREETEIDLAKERIMKKSVVKKAEVVIWLKSFCNGDPFDEEYQYRIISTFVDKVYLYDDKIIIFYNISGGKQISYVDAIDPKDELDDMQSIANGSDSFNFGEPKKPNRSNDLFGFFYFLLLYSNLHPKVNSRAAVNCSKGKIMPVACFCPWRPPKQGVS